MQGDIDKAKFFLLEILHEHPTFISFLFESLNESSKLNSKEVTTFKTNLEKLFDYFLEMNDPELGSMPAVVLTKIRILKERARFIESYELLKTFVEAHKEIPEYVLAEYVKILIMLKKFDIAAVYTEVFLSVHFKATTKHYCKSCGYNSDEIFWRCPQCYKWETIQFRWKL
jgi:lipopolysaccharide biosynthesis regulator YciM